MLVLSCVAAWGCDAQHLMLATTIENENLGAVSLAIDSSPVIAPDGESVIYLVRGSSTLLPVVSRNLRNLSEHTLFTVPAGSALWTMNYHAGTLVFSLPNSSGGGHHVMEYTVAGDTVQSFTGVNGADDIHPAISPDGALLIFVRAASGITQLMRRDAKDGSATPQVVSDFSNNEDIHVIRWLDDQRVLVSSAIVGNPAFNQVRYLSSRVDNQPGMGEWATAGPGGHPVASLLGSTGAVNWWLSELDGAAMTAVTRSQSDKRLLNWSMDGRTLVYEAVDETNVTRLEVATLPPFR